MTLEIDMEANVSLEFQEYGRNTYFEGYVYSEI